MNRTRIISLLTLCAAGVILAQNTITTGVSKRNGSGSLTTGSFTTTSTAGLDIGSSTLISGTGTLTFVGPNTWVSAETRKDDGKGPTAKDLDTSAVVLQARNLASPRYQEIALSIGLNPSPILDEARLLDAIHELGLRVYDFEKVDQYLYRKALRQSALTRWVWKPLREADTSLVDFSPNPEKVGIVYRAQYAHAVPLRVLESVAAILEKVPDARFLVSDYEVVRPDPFLAVTTEKLMRASKILIVERWDEPGYDEDGGAAKATVVARR